MLALWTRGLLDELRPGWRDDGARIAELELEEPDELRGTGPLIPHDDMVRVWASLTEHRDDFGIEFGERNARGSIGLLAYASAHADDLRSALDMLVKLQRLADTQNEVALVIDGTSAVLRHRPPSRHAPWPVALAESVLAAAAHLGRTFTSGALVFQRIRFQHAGPRPASVARWFGCPVEVDADANEMIFDRRLLALPLRAADRTMFASITAAGMRAVEQLPGGDLVDAARAAVRTRLDSRVTISEIADHLNVSPRTLQRRLEASGLTFPAAARRSPPRGARRARAHGEAARGRRQARLRRSELAAPAAPSAKAVVTGGA